MYSSADPVRRTNVTFVRLSPSCLIIILYSTSLNGIRADLVHEVIGDSAVNQDRIDSRKCFSPVTAEEMCMIFAYYYPAMTTQKRFQCGGRPDHAALAAALGFKGKLEPTGRSAILRRD